MMSYIQKFPSFHSKECTRDYLSYICQENQTNARVCSWENDLLSDQVTFFLVDLCFRIVLDGTFIKHLFEFIYIIFTSVHSKLLVIDQLVVLLLVV